MKWIVCSVLIFLGTSVFAGDENKDHNYSPGLSKRGSDDTESSKDYVGYSNESNFNNFDREKSNTYRMSVSPPSGGTFIPDSSCSGEVTKDEENLVEGKKLYSKDSIPTSTYIIEMSGQVGFGGEGGNPATWGAYVRNKYFWLEPIEKIVVEGTAVTITANGVSAESTWTVNNKVWKDWRTPNSSAYTTSAISLNRDMWDKMQWTPSPVPDGWKCPPPGVYNISASTTEESGAQSARATIYVVELKFLTPAGDPVNDPSNNNEFVYNSANPGVLTLNLSVQVTPADMADKIKDGCTFSVGDIEGAAMMWHADNPNGKPKANNGKLEATVTFTGLPSKNSSLGKKTATIAYSGIYGSITVTQDYEVFFSKDDSNHPACPSCSSCPNWFFYWREGNVCGIPSNALYDPNGSFGWCQPHIDSIIRLGPDAATTNTGPEKYYKIKNNNSTSITVTGNGKGIKCVAETIAHEQFHITIYSNHRGSVDSDNDGVGDSFEQHLLSINTDPQNPDTYNMGGAYSQYGDDEIRCRKKELIPVGYDVSKDWAYPGCQSKKPFGP